jgi:hypothetical protein
VFCCLDSSCLSLGDIQAKVIKTDEMNLPAVCFAVATLVDYFVSYCWWWRLCLCYLAGCFHLDCWLVPVLKCVSFLKMCAANKHKFAIALLW